MIIELERDNFFMLNWLNDYLVGHKGFICGGCFKNIFNKEKVKDLDIFFKSEEDWNSAVQYFDERSVGYVSPFSGEPLSEKEAEFRFSYKNEKVKAYMHLKSGVAIELCKSIFGEPKDIIKSFEKVFRELSKLYKEQFPFYYKNGVLNKDEYLKLLLSFQTFYHDLIVIL